MERRWDTHTENIRVELAHTGAEAASCWVAAGTRSAKGPTAEPKLARVGSQQTCGMNARQDRIASGSCCCSQLGQSRSRPEFRTESSAATAHSMADRHE